MSHLSILLWSIYKRRRWQPPLCVSSAECCAAAMLKSTAPTSSHWHLAIRVQSFRSSTDCQNRFATVACACLVAQAPQFVLAVGPDVLTVHSYLQWPPSQLYAQRYGKPRQLLESGLMNMHASTLCAMHQNSGVAFPPIQCIPALDWRDWLMIAGRVGYVTDSQARQYRL